jgi:hypothetical protein
LFDGVAARSYIAWAALSLCSLAYFQASEHLVHKPRIGTAAEFSVRLPVMAQVLMAMGDRQLAANLSGFRVLVAETERMSKEDYAIQAGLQRDISWLNPAHEDNYYIAAAILPWGGQLEATQVVLQRAADARPFDYLPLFHLGFNHYHFYRNPAKGAEILLSAVPRTKDQQDQWALQNVAALWIERGYRLGDAAGRVEAMANAAPPGGFRKYLMVRASRLRDLDRLRSLARQYEQQYGHHLVRLDDLVRRGLLERIPPDPLGVGFGVDAKGEPVFRDALRGSRQ